MTAKSSVNTSKLIKFDIDLLWSMKYHASLDKQAWDELICNEQGRDPANNWLPS